jgi:hypothetical protein
MSLLVPVSKCSKIRVGSATSERRQCSDGSLGYVMSTERLADSPGVV